MKKLLVSLLVCSLLFQANFVLAQNVSSTDLSTLITQLKKQIEALQAQVTELQSQLATAKEEIKEVKEEIKFNKTLVFGTTGEEVKQLQEFLKSMPDIYPEGKVTGYFGFLTQAAVRRFQEKHGIESVGFAGPKTIAKLNQVVGATPATPAIPAVPTEQKAIPAIPATPPLFSLPEPTQPPPPPPPPSTTTPPPTPPPSCTESWSCGEWSACVSGTQTKICNDLNSCGTTNNKPATSQSCTVDIVPPSVPTVRSAIAYPNWCTSQITFNWAASTDNVGVTGYKIYRSGPDGTYTFTYTDTRYPNNSFNSYGFDGKNLLAGTTYSYTIAAFDAAGNMSNQTSPISVTTCIKPVMVYPNGGETLTTGSSIDLKWRSPTSNNSVINYNSSFYLVSASDPYWKVLEIKKDVASNAGENTTSWTVTTNGASVAYGGLAKDLGPGQYYIRICPAGTTEYWITGATSLNCDDSDAPVTIAVQSTSQLDRQNLLASLIKSLLLIIENLKQLAE